MPHNSCLVESLTVFSIVSTAYRDYLSRTLVEDIGIFNETFMTQAIIQQAFCIINKNIYTNGTKLIISMTFEKHPMREKDL